MAKIKEGNNDNIKNSTNSDSNVNESVPSKGVSEKNKEIERLKSEIENYKSQVEKLDQDLKEKENNVKLAQAELVNYRKRKDEETSNLLKYANQDLVVDLVPVLDNLERAVNTDESKLDEPTKKFLQGFKMLSNNFKETLAKYGVEEIPTVGEPFDPMVHEALMVKQDESKPNEVVLECLMKGYTLKGKVIRPSKVVVNQL